MRDIRNTEKKRSYWSMRALFLIFSISSFLIFFSCARMGTPDGGWYDETPPRIIHSSPADRSTHVTNKKINIYFNEYIKVADASQNVIVSPPQKEVPEVKVKGKRVVIELEDSLKPNTTYTIDFSDAITDFTEDNPLGNYTYTFSTGEQIDTLEMSGYVIDASNLEPIKGILVGLYNELEDSVFRKKPLMRVARTDASGHFTIRGVSPGEYRVYALKDADNDYMFTQKSEMIAFSHQIFSPSVTTAMRQDTIWRDIHHIDSISQVTYQRFLPDDIVLNAFQEVQTGRYLIKTERKDADRINMFFSYGSEKLPVIKGLNFQSDDAFILEKNAKQDTLTYWLRDTLLIHQDTLRFSMEYEMTDTLGRLVMQTDTIEALAKVPYEKRLKEEKKAFENWQKEQEKKKKREERYDSIYPTPHLEPTYNIASAMDPDRSIFIEVPAPLEKLDTAGIHLYSKIDSLWYRAPFKFQPCPEKLRQYEVITDWHPGTEYSFEVDSAAFVDIYGLVSGEFKRGIKVKTLDEYSSLVLQISGAPDTVSIVVELLNGSDKMVKRAQVGADGTAQFYYVVPGTYFARAFLDRNNNGIWDTGNYDEDLQAEEMYYYPRQIDAKAKWDITQSWNLTAVPQNRQKPSALVKQKAEDKKTVKNRNAERASQLGIPYNPSKKQ